MKNNQIEKKVVICGSMSCFDKMLELKRELNSYKINTVIPEDEAKYESIKNGEQYFKFKRKVSEEYFKKIRKKEVFAILVINKEKRGIPNYIGANTFAEIAIAINAKKKVYLLNDIPDTYYDELISWEVFPLNKNLNKLIKDYNDLINYEKNQLNLKFEE